MTNSPTGNKFKDELDFTNGILEGISQKKADPVASARQNVSKEEISEIKKMGDIASEITGLDGLAQSKTKGSDDLIESCLMAIDCHREIPIQLSEKVLKVIERVESYQKFLKKFQAKYGS